MLEAVLLVVKGPPLSAKRKGGLFPVTIRQHCAIAKKVFVLSVGDRVGRKAVEVTDLGDAIYVNRMVSGLSSIMNLSASSLLSSLVYRDVVAHLRNEGVQVVVALQSAHRTGRPATSLARLLHVPYATWEHSSSYEDGRYSGRRRAQLRAYFENAAGVTAVSEPVLRHIEEVCRIDLGATVVVPNPVPDVFEFETVGSSPPRSPGPEGGPIFGGWTNWRPIKRLDLLADAFKLVLRDLPNAKLVIAGPIDEGLRDQLDHPRIQILGNLSREAVRRLALSVDVCCVPSDHETFGLPVVEALAAGTPVVSTDADGPASILLRPYLGRIVPRGDIESFARAMVDVATNRDAYPAHDIRAYAIQRFGQNAQVERWRSFYEMALKSA